MKIYFSDVFLFSTAFFQRRRKYNVPVHMCIHPELNHYIRNLLDGVKPLLREGQVESIAVLIRDKVQDIVCAQLSVS